MASFKQGDVIKVPFPYTDRPTRQSRPALVVSIGGIEASDAKKLGSVSEAVFREVALRLGQELGLAAAVV